MLNNNILIGISGKKTSGKSTVAEIIKEIYQNNTIILNFGDAVKESLKPIFGFSDEELYGSDKEKVNEYWGITPREIMQYYATDLMRYELSKKFKDIGTDIWVRCIERKLYEINKKESNKIIIIADLRFKNEYELVKKYNGYTLKVFRQIDNLNSNFIDHISENELNNEHFDYLISNNGSIEDLKFNVKKILKFIN